MDGFWTAECLANQIMVAILGEDFTIILNYINITVEQGRVYYDNLRPQGRMFWIFFENFCEFFQYHFTAGDCVSDIYNTLACTFLSTHLEAHARNKGIRKTLCREKS